jgi:fumarylacetoacetase
MLQIPENSDFTIANLPWGIFSTADRSPRAGVAIGNQIIDLQHVSELGEFDHLGIDRAVFMQPVLNDFIRLGKTLTNQVRTLLRDSLLSPTSLFNQLQDHFLVPQSAATLHLPINIGDYTDFYSSIEHATNVGKMFRDPANALLPNWRHLPVGYHGRASSIVASGTPIRRPHGQVLPKGSEMPVFQASARLDFELEMAFVVGKDSYLGQPVAAADAEDYIFGLMLFNDWSARDIQQWEYVPLGPFLGKNFASAVSPWIVPLEALEPYRVSGPIQTPEVLPYLATEGAKNYDIDLTVSITPANGPETVVSRSNFKYMYWNMCQQLAHHTVNGCNLRVGDLMASGTISGPDEGSYGSMLELAWMGTKPLTLADGSQRVFIQDGDTVTLRGTAGSGDTRVGFGEVLNQILPANG